MICLVLSTSLNVQHLIFTASFPSTHPPTHLLQVPLEKEKVRLLLNGLASHHAGLLPVYKALVEELFNDNLVKVNPPTHPPTHPLKKKRRSTHPPTHPPTHLFRSSLPPRPWPLA